MLRTAFALASDLRPLLSWLLRLSGCLVVRAVHAHKANTKLHYVLLRLFRTLYERGFCGAPESITQSPKPAWMVKKDLFQLEADGRDVLDYPLRVLPALPRRRRHPVLR